MPTERMSIADYKQAIKKVGGGRKQVKHDYKAELIQQLELARLPLPEREFYFAKPRKWRFDFAYPDLMIAVEYEGGVYSKRVEDGKGHQSVKGYEKDCRKYTEAALRGWTLIRITGKLVETGEALQFIERALKGRNQ